MDAAKRGTAQLTGEALLSALGVRSVAAADEKILDTGYEELEPIFERVGSWEPPCPRGSEYCEFRARGAWNCTSCVSSVIVEGARARMQRAEVGQLVF